MCKVSDHCQLFEQLKGKQMFCLNFVHKYFTFFDFRCLAYLPQYHNLRYLIL